MNKSKNPPVTIFGNSNQTSKYTKNKFKVVSKRKDFIQNKSANYQSNGNINSKPQTSKYSRNTNLIQNFSNQQENIKNLKNVKSFKDIYNTYQTYDKSKNHFDDKNPNGNYAHMKTKSSNNGNLQTLLKKNDLRNNYSSK